jgi:hypothetical protein
VHFHPGGLAHPPGGPAPADPYGLVVDRVNVSVRL